MTRFVAASEASAYWRAGVVYGGSPETSQDPRAARLEQCVDQAESLILNYLKVGADSPAWEPEAADLPTVQAAILVIGKTLYDDDQDGQARAMDGIVKLMLARLRDPALA